MICLGERLGLRRLVTLTFYPKNFTFEVVEVS